jgi:hypothetical protein
MLRIDKALFPQKTSAFASYARIPVLYRPILGSPEQFVVGALCYGPDRRHLERANNLSRLDGFYGPQAVGVILAIEIGLDALAAALLDPEFSIVDFRSPVSEMALGAEEIVEGRSLEEVAKTWLEAASSLQAEPMVQGYVDGATDILDDLKARPPVRDMEKIRAGLVALGYPAAKIEKIVGCFEGKPNGGKTNAE